MAVEIQLNRYLYHQAPVDDVPYGPPIVKVNRPKLKSNIPHNYLHDIESVWWIAIWTALRIVPMNATVDGVKTMRSLFTTIFPNSAGGSTPRTDFLLGPYPTIETTPQYRAHWEMSQAILRAHKLLMDHYMDFERKGKDFVMQNRFSTIYDLVATHFKTAMDKAPSLVTFLGDAPEPTKPEGGSEVHENVAVPTAASEAPTRQPKRRITAVPAAAGEAPTRQPKKRKIAAAPTGEASTRKSKRLMRDLTADEESQEGSGLS